MKAAYDTKKVFHCGVVGLLAAIMTSAFAFHAPLMFLQVSLAEAKTGMLVVKVTDAPVPDLSNLNLTINQVEVCDETGQWTPIHILGEEAYFDLLRLENVTMDLAIAEMTIGNYTKIRMQIISANATLADSRTLTLNVPSGRIDINVHFEIKPGKTTSLIIDILVDKIHIAERGKSGKPANLNPQFKAIVIPPNRE